MVIVVSETQTQTPTTTQKKKKTKKKEETQPTPTPTPTPTPPPPKEKPETKKKTKETKPTTKETKPTTQPTTKPKPKKKLVIKTITWEKFEKFETKRKTPDKSWIMEVIERAKKEPIQVRNLTKGKLIALIAHVNRYNQNNTPKIEIKYDMEKGIALLAPSQPKHPKTQ
jgi:outer membrane biosynthesis protein TonB